MQLHICFEVYSMKPPKHPKYFSKDNNRYYQYKITIKAGTEYLAKLGMFAIPYGIIDKPLGRITKRRF